MFSAPRRRTLLIAAALGFAGFGPAWAFGLDDLMKQLSGVPAATTRFTEQRFVSGLDAPLQSSGTLSFKAPGHFERVTVRPRAESLVVDGNEVRMERGGQSRTLTLDSVPEVAGLIAAIRGTLTGDAALLKRNFDTQVTGDAAEWLMKLVPREPRLAAQVLRMRIAGQRAALTRIEIDLAGGDYSVMKLEPVASAAR